MGIYNDWVRDTNGHLKNFVRCFSADGTEVQRLNMVAYHWTQNRVKTTYYGFLSDSFGERQIGTIEHQHGGGRFIVRPTQTDDKIVFRSLDKAVNFLLDYVPSELTSDVYTYR